MITRYQSTPSWCPCHVARLRVDTLTWNRPAALVTNDTVHRARVSPPRRAARAGRHLVLRFRRAIGPAASRSPGPNGGRGTGSGRHLANGSFVSFEYFPVLGYQESLELGLRCRPREGEAPPASDALARRRGRAGRDATSATMRIGSPSEATVSTAPDQIAIAPGYLVRSTRRAGAECSSTRWTARSTTSTPFLSGATPFGGTAPRASSSRSTITRATSSTWTG